jgi:glycolate oxidase FAD binding subunit
MAIEPESTEELREAVASAVAEGAPLEVVGGGSKRGIGRATQTRAALDLSALRGVTIYEPEELVFSARAATPLAEAHVALADRGQEFAFEPPDLSRLLRSDHAGTLGGMIAAGFSGPRRIKAGAVRDHFLGFHAVSGRGEVFQAGSRVMKNVTGYDLPKLMAGSWGTLAIMTDVTLKVLPRAQTQTTVVLWGLDDGKAVRAMSTALQSPCDVSAAAHLPAAIAARSAIDELRSAKTAATLLRLEGVAPSVTARTAQLRNLLRDLGTLDELDEQRSLAAWIEVRDVHFLSDPGDRLVWRLSVPPAEGAAVLQRIREKADARGFYDWAGGLIWLDLPPSPDGSAKLVRSSLSGGHATLIRAPLDVRAAIPIFHPQPPALAALTRRVKEAFDPKGILNPGRMYAES